MNIAFIISKKKLKLLMEPLDIVNSVIVKLTRMNKIMNLKKKVSIDGFSSEEEYKTVDKFIASKMSAQRREFFAQEMEKYCFIHSIRYNISSNSGQSSKEVICGTFNQSLNIQWTSDICYIKPLPIMLSESFHLTPD